MNFSQSLVFYFVISLDHIFVVIALEVSCMLQGVQNMIIFC